MIDNTQELGEILDEFLTDIYMNNEYFAANQEALDKTKEEPMRAILDWHNKQTLELLDRLIAQQWSFGEDDDALAVPTRYIEAERNKLKED